MKRIYLLMAAALGLATTATAQRNVDLRVKHYYVLGTGTTVSEITDGTHILFDGDKNYPINVAFEIINDAANVADSVMITDTIKIAAELFNFRDQNFHVPGAGGTSGIFGVGGFPQAIEPGTNAGQPWDDLISKPVNWVWCDSIFIVSPVGSSNPATDINSSNNKVCNNVIIDGWMTGVEDVIINGNGLEVYPNPSNGNMSVVYNFGNNNSGIITIVDMTGKVVYTQQLEANLRGTQTIKIQTRGLANGLYSLRLATGNKVAVEKIYINN